MAAAQLGGTVALFCVRATVVASAVQASAFFAMACAGAFAGTDLVVAFAVFGVLVTVLAGAVSAGALAAVAGAGTRAFAGFVAALTCLFVVSTMLAGALLALAGSAVALAWGLSTCARLQMATATAFILSAK
jgi:hypothetical protein